MILFLYSWIALSGASQVRTVSASSCDIIPIYLALGMTTQLVFDDEPKVTLFADKDHFQIQGTKEAPRRLAVIPLIRSSELRMPTEDLPANPEKMAQLLDRTFKTNLFVFFARGEQLMFQLRFAPKDKADFSVRVKRKWGKGCDL